MGKRVRMPSLKAQQAMEAVKSMGQQKKKGTQAGIWDGGAQSSITKKQTQETPVQNTNLQGDITNLENLMITGSPSLPSGGGSVETVRDEVATTQLISNKTVTGRQSSNARKLSWAEEAEVEIDTRGSVWDNFDISKVANAGFKLDFVEPKKHGDEPVCEIELEDISSELEYWKNSVVCYVLGAHPPYEVLKGFIQRLWLKHGINKISMLKNGIVLLRFDSAVGKNEVLQRGIYHFDSKLFIVKAWTPDMEFT